MASLITSVSLSQNPQFIFQVFLYAFIGGLLPALIWLWFWMHEGHEHHEPKNTLWMSFILGMAGVFAIYPLQLLAQFFVGKGDESVIIITVWAALEEFMKYALAYWIALRHKDIFDEPIDAFVYLMN